MLLLWATLYLIINQKFLKLIPSLFHLFNSVPGYLMIDYHKQAFENHLVRVFTLLHSFVILIEKFCMLLYSSFHIFVRSSKLFNYLPDTPDSAHNSTEPYNLITGDCEPHLHYPPRNYSYPQ